MTSHIYLDNNATTPLDHRVWEVMGQADNLLPLNPSSTHFFGRKAKQLLNQSRLSIAQSFSVHPQEIVFTSGGTESMNLLIMGHLSHQIDSHVISSDIEHPSVQLPLQALEKRGLSVTYLPSGRWGAPRPSAVEQAIRKKTRLIVLSMANHETGVRLEVDSIAEIAHRRRVPLILDGVAFLGKERLSVPQGVQGIGFSAHKIHGPRGIGCLLVRKGFAISPTLLGGSQESGLRAGTENLSGALGMAAAVEILSSSLAEDREKMKMMRHLLETELRSHIPGLEVNGEGTRLSNTSHLYFPGISGDVLLMHLDLDGVAVSRTSACDSGREGPSPILLKMGFSKERASNSVRFSFSRMNTKEETMTAISKVVKIFRRLRHTSSSPSRSER